MPAKSGDRRRSEGDAKIVADGPICAWRPDNGAALHLNGRSDGRSAGHEKQSRRGYSGEPYDLDRRRKSEAPSWRLDELRGAKINRG
jgi:hypothetical protein